MAASEELREVDRPSRLETWYLHLYDRVLSPPRRVLTAVVLVSALASTALTGLRLDMSFRPLFGQDEEALEATRTFEARFGQRSGAYVGAILTPAAWDTSFARALVETADALEGVPGITEVLGLPRAAVPVWTRGAAESRWLVEARDPASPETLAHLLELRDVADLRRTLVSEDGERTLLLARLDPPLEDLRARVPIIERFKAVVSESTGEVATVQWVGISVVEEAYARLVLRGMGISLLLTTVFLLAALYLAYRRIGAVVVVMSGVGLAIPLAMATMVLRGQAVTIVNSMVPTMILIIGVADAIHMLESYAGHLRTGRPTEASVRAMFGDMALPCLLTALTTIAGVLALATARMDALRDFGINVAVGIALVYVANLLVLPALLRMLPAESVIPSRRARPSLLDAWRERTGRLLVRHPGAVAVGVALLMAGSVAGVRLLDVDQRFNEDVAPGHPARVAQATFEEEFTGILGPDVVVRRNDGAPILGDADRSALSRLVVSLEELPGVIHVESVLDFVPPQVPSEIALDGALGLRSDARLGSRVRDVLDADGTGTTVVVRTRDVGSEAALELVDRIERTAARELGDVYDARVVGQWWLAQLGLAGLLRDMLLGFATSFLLVLPLMALALGRLRLLPVAVVPNLLPPLFALGFMGWVGISVRVGTAMVLAIALAIAVDDTIHVVVRLAREARRSSRPDEQVRRCIDHVGGPVLLTTVVLVAGFASMRLNGLLAIQDMGVVAAATLGVAFLADVYFLPALYLVASRRRSASVTPEPGPLTPEPGLRGAPVADTSTDVCRPERRSGSLQRTPSPAASTDHP